MIYKSEGHDQGRAPSLLCFQPAQKIPFRHSVLEGFLAVDEDNRNFIAELPVQNGVGIYIHFPPSEAGAAFELGKRLFNDCAQVAAFSRIDDDLVQSAHIARV